MKLAADWHRVALREFLAWPARYLWMAAAGGRIESARAERRRAEAGSLRSQLARRDRGGGVTAEPLF